MSSLGKTIAFFNKKTVVGQPINSRICAFYKYFMNEGFSENQVRPDYVFFSMPPFRNISIFFKYSGRVILDIRDGWSIAQAKGYGGIVRKRPVKSWFVRRLERFMIRRSYLTITCTPGLRSYLEDISGRKVLLVPNGISEERLELICSLRNKTPEKPKADDSLVFACAGKFSEYGIDKVKRLLGVIVSRYKNNKLKVKLIGSDPESNAWVADFFCELSQGRGEVEILPRMDDVELFKSMLYIDFGIALLRDPGYEFGTKVYDYIALGIPIINYFSVPNEFTDYFDACLDVPFGRNLVRPEIKRGVLISKGLESANFP